MPFATFGCPSCSTTEAVRAAVLAEGFWTTLGVLVLPLAVIVTITGFLYRIGRRAQGAP